MIASPDVVVEGLSREELERIFLFKRRFWRRSQPIVLLLPADGLPAREFLLEEIWRLSSDEVRRLILEKLFQGELDLAPKSVSSDREAISFVSSARGALAVVSSQAVAGDEVPVLRIDGKLPGERGYPLRH